MHIERGSHVITGITGALLAVLLGVKQGRHRRGRQMCYCNASRKASGLRAPVVSLTEQLAALHTKPCCIPELLFPYTSALVALPFVHAML